MSEETVVAAPSAAQESTTPSFEIPRSGTPEYVKWRNDGTLPDSKPKTADTATADTSKEATPGPDKAEHAPDAGAGKTTQESRRKLDAEARIKQLTDELRAIRGELDEVRRPKTPTQAESSTAKPAEQAQPQNYAEWRKTFKPSRWIENYAKDNPEATYEDGNAAMADFLGDVRDQFRAQEQTRQSLAASVKTQMDEARSRYGDFDAVAEPAALKVVALIHNPQVNATLKQVMLQPGGPEIIYALGKDPAIVAKMEALALSDPAEAIYLWKSLQAEARKETAGSSATRNDKGQFVKDKPETPAKRGPESAAEPPLEIGNRGGGTMDESERALKASEGGDLNAFRDWKRAEDAKEMRRRKGL